MKEVIDNIIEIDKKTQTLVSNTNKQIVKEKEELRKKIAELEKQSVDNAKKEAQERFDEIISKAESEVEKRKALNLKELKMIEENYQDKKDKLIEQAFKNIILNVDDD
jgi:F0F1-type ATP synthase membrane subunit b/b'